LNYGFEQSCGTNMIFDAVACTCVPSPDDQVEEDVCDPDMLLFFPFDEDLNDHSCNRAAATQTSVESVLLTNDAERGTVAFFGGASSLHVGFLYNYFADQFISEWSVAAWVKRTGDSSAHAGVVNNGDCIGEPSFDIHVGEGEVSFASVTTDGVTATASTEAASIMHDDWEHVAMVYDGSALTMYVNGVATTTTPASGYIENRQCAMNIGSLHAGTGYFQGYMDNIYVYRRALTPAEVTSFANV
jgi:hypothetical protein